MHQESYQWYVGIDSGSQEHWVCLLDCQGQSKATRKFEHSGAGLAAMMKWLKETAPDPPERVAIGIETPRGAVVEGLVERRYAVFSINPKQLDRFRDRYSMSGAKDDIRDALVLADCLRTDQRCYHRVRLDEKRIYRLRELSRMEEDLREQSRLLSNQLWAQLNRYYPQLLRLCPAADEAWLWDLLQRAPEPEKGAHLKKPQVNKILRNYRIRRVSADDVLQQLREPALQLAPGAMEAASEHAVLLLPRLHLLRTQRIDLSKRISGLLAELSAADSDDDQQPEHRDAEVLLSLPGVGQSNGATMLAEASQPLAERDYHAVRCLSGAAPVTRQSGKKKVVVMRRGCNPRLRNALYHWGRCSIQQDEYARQYYDRLRQKGQTHGQALRTICDRWLRILISMLRTNTLYDPQRFARLEEPEASAAA